MKRTTPEQLARIHAAAELRHKTSPKLIAAETGLHVASVRRIMRWYLLGELSRGKSAKR